MTASGWAWLVVASVLAALDWYAVIRQRRRLERVAKPGVLICLILAALVANPHHQNVQGWLVAALVLGLIGDIALVWQSEPAAEPVLVGAAGRFDLPRVPRMGPGREPNPRSGWLFLLGLASFLLGHLCYSIAMLRFGPDPLSVAFGLVLMLIVLFVFGYRIIAGAHALGGSPLTVGVTAYIIALGSAVVLGIGTTELLVAYGVVLFALSDLVLADDRFVQARTWAPITVAVTYHLAQALLLLGLLR
jgi:uncharacterized membrane protein YhhN